MDTKLLHGFIGEELPVYPVKDYRDLTDTKKRILRFGVLSGNFPETGIALPLNTPRGTRDALQALILYKGKSFVAKAKINFLKLCVLFLEILLRKQFLVAFDPAKENFISFLAAGLGVEAEDIDFSIYAGSRKFLLPLFQRHHGLLGYAKVYFPGIESVEYGENEVAILRKLSRLGLQSGITPEVLFSGYFHNYFVVVLSSFPGLKNVSSITPEHIEWLKELSRKTGRRVNFLESEFYTAIKKETDFIKAKAKDKEELVSAILKKVIDYFGGRQYLFSLAMREFPYVQMMKLNKKNFVIDWEQARFDFPPIFDLFSLFMSKPRYTRGNYVELYEKNAESIFLKSNKKTAIIFRDMFSFWEITQKDAYFFFLAFLIDQLYIHLHVGHARSGARVVALLEKMLKSEEFSLEKWFGGA